MPREAEPLEVRIARLYERGYKRPCYIRRRLSEHPKIQVILDVMSSLGLELPPKRKPGGRPLSKSLLPLEDRVFEVIQRTGVTCPHLIARAITINRKHPKTAEVKAVLGGLWESKQRTYDFEVQVLVRAKQGFDVHRIAMTTKRSVEDVVQVLERLGIEPKIPRSYKKKRLD